MWCLTVERGSLLGLLNSDGLGPLVQLSLSLQSHDSASPLARELRVLVELLQAQFLEDLELRLVFLVDSSEGNNSSSLLVNKSSKTSLILDDEERDLHLSAEGRKPKDKLDGVHITCDENQGGLLLLNEGGDVLQSELELVGDVGGLALSLGSIGGGSALTLLLGSGGLRPVAVQKLEDISGLVLANRLGELVDGRGDLEALVEDGALTLDAHVLGPTDETAEVTASGADGSTDVEGTRAGGEEGVGLGGRRLDGGLTLGLGGFLGRHDDDCC